VRGNDRSIGQVRGRDLRPEPRTKASKSHQREQRSRPLTQERAPPARGAPCSPFGAVACQAIFQHFLSAGNFMSRRKDSFWHDLGHRMEAIMSFVSGSTTRSPAHRSKSRPNSDGDLDRPPSATGDTEILGGAVAALVLSLVAKWSRSRKPAPRSLAKGAAAGAVVAGAALLIRILVTRTNEDALSGNGAGESAGEVIDELLAGAGRGLIYAALLAPHLPGPPIIRGALTGTADYLAAPLGGLFSRLQAISPIRRAPVISILLETGDAEDDPFLAFLIQGMLLGLIYGHEPDDL